MTSKVIFFDLDDTLLDHTGASRKALQQVFSAQLNLGHVQLDDLDRMNSEIYDQLMPGVFQGKYDLRHARAERFRQMFERCGSAFTLDQCHQIFETYRSHYETGRALLPGVLDVLRQLSSQVQLGIITNGPQTSPQDVDLLEGLIPHWFVSGEVGFRKPEPEIFHLALQALNCCPEEAVMVGDMWATDIAGAKNLGMGAVWINPGGLPAPDPEVAQLQGFADVDLAVQLLLNVKTGPKPGSHLQSIT